MKIFPCSFLKPISAWMLLIQVAGVLGASTQDGEEARWLVQSSKWATLSWLENGEVQSLVTSIAQSDGRIFFYLMEDTTFNGSITISEAQLDPTQFDGARCGPDGDLDPEDPVSFRFLVLLLPFFPQISTVTKNLIELLSFLTPSQSQTDHPALW